jgi:hypothetical protein
MTMRHGHLLAVCIPIALLSLFGAARAADIRGVSDTQSPVGGEVLQIDNDHVTAFDNPEPGPKKLWYWVRSGDGRPTAVYPQAVIIAPDGDRKYVRTSSRAVAGQWTEMGSTFTVPEGTRRLEIFWQVTPADQAALVAGLTVAPATDTDGYENLQPGPHPYLYFRGDDVPALREKTRQAMARDVWTRVKDEADRIVESDFLPRITHDAERAVEQARGHARNAKVLAFAYALTGDERYAERARREVADILVAEQWTHPKHRGQADLVSAEISFAVGVVYDWLHGQLSAAERQRWRDVVIERGLEPIFRDSAEGVWWSSWYRCNWGAVIHGQAGVAALALLGEDPRVPMWVTTCREKIRLHRQQIGRDGGWGEGATYTTYAWVCATYFMSALQHVTGGRENLFDDADLRQAHLYHIHMLEPDRSGFVKFSNCGTGISRSGEYYRKFAAESGDPHAQWMADLMRSWSAATNIFGFLWCDPGLEAKPPTDLPLARHFRDIHWAVTRTSWTDPGAILFALKGGYNDWDHHHHDLNHFVLYAHGRPLITDLGYPHETWGCLTEAHNTIAVNDKEQLNGVKVAGGRGGSDHWCEISDFMHTPEYDYLKGDATRGYDPDDVRRFVREVMFVRPGGDAEPTYFVIFDEIEATGPSRFDWHLHTFGDMAVDDATIRIRQDGAAVAVKMLLPEAFEHELLSRSWEETGISKPFPTAIADTFIKLRPAEQTNSARFLALLFPQTIEEGERPACPDARIIQSDGLLGAAIESGDVRDVALFSLGARPIVHDGIRTDAARCFVRMRAGRVSRFAVHRATFLEVAAQRVFASRQAASQAKAVH